MATAEIDRTLKDVSELVSHFIIMPETKMFIDYDKEADVLCISFKTPHETYWRLPQAGYPVKLVA